MNEYDWSENTLPGGSAGDDWSDETAPCDVSGLSCRPRPAPDDVTTRPGFVPAQVAA